MRKVIAAVGGAVAAVAALRWLRRRKEDIDWRSARPPGAIVDVDGVPIHYIERGSGPAAAVLIHGFLGHTYSFRYLIPELAKDGQARHRPRLCRRPLARRRGRDAPRRELA